MAKKIVRGITDVKTITNQDFDTNNVNDLLSDGQYSYIHRKKGKSEEYHNLTDNIKTLSSDNTDLLSVTNNNKTTNTATLHPKHDAQKEQVLQSTRNTVNIQHGTNATPEKTTVDTNPAKVLEHDNLINEYGVSKRTLGNSTKIGLEYTPVPNDFNLDTLTDGRVRANRFINGPSENTWYFVSSFNEGLFRIQEAITLIDDKNTTYRRLRNNGVWGEWREQVGDKSTLDTLLAQKQNTLTAMGGISITGNNISLLSLDEYSEDLNNLTYTCQAKPTLVATNLPDNVIADGVLSVNRVGDLVSQTYHAIDNTIYYRISYEKDGAYTWSSWVKVTTTEV